METVKGVVIIAYKNPDRPRYLVLKRKKNWEGWETPKGHLENDDYEATVRMELEEEAGVQEEEIRDIQEMDETLEWTYEKEDGGEEKRDYRAFLVELAEDAHVNVTGNPHDEHESGFFFRFRDASSLLTYQDNVELLEKAHQRLGN